MRLPSAPRWFRFLLVPLGLMVVVPAWLLAVIAGRIAAVRLPRTPPLFRLLLALVLPVLAALACAVAIDNGVHPFMLMGFVPIAVLLALVTAQALSAPDAQGDDLLPQLEPKTTWRLCDPNLSTSGVWRAEIGSYPPGVEGFGDDKLVREYVCDLIRDWSFRSGWPYLGCRIRQVSRAAPNVTGTFPFVSESEAVYSVTLAIGERLQRGWMRFGDGFAEFQLEPEPWTRSVHAAADLRKRVSLRLPSEADARRPVPARSRPPVLAGPHPLWDRWLDG